MSWDYRKLKQTLQSLHYENVDETAQQVLEATRKYSGLTAGVELFKFNNGNQESRLLLTGRIMIQNEGSYYNIPILIWLPTAYPDGGPPDVFVKPTFNMPVKSDPCFIDDTGKVSMFWLDSWGWNCYGRSNMVVELIEELIQGFNQRLPVTRLRSVQSVGCRLWCPSTVMKMCSPTEETPSPLSTKRHGLEIRKTLQENLYENVNETLTDILEATLKYVDLDAVLDNFSFNNGTQESLVTLKLPVRIVYKETSYSIPVVIWLPKKYPYQTPKVFVKPSSHRPIDTDSKYVNEKGLVLVSEYHFRVRVFFRRLDLVELIDALGVTFSDQPPVRFEPAKETLETPCLTDPRLGVARKTCCLLCFQPILKCESWSKIDPMVLAQKCKVLRTFCQHMMTLHPDDVPTVISEDMFPFCCPCEELVDRLWECYEKISKTKLEMAGITQTVEKKVVECKELLTSPSDATEKRFIKLREVIYEDYQKRLWIENNYHNEESNIDDIDNDRSSELGQSFPASSCSDEEMERNELTQMRPDRLDVTQKQKVNLAAVKVEVKARPRSKFEYDAEDDPLFEESQNMVKIEVDESESEEEDDDFEGSSMLRISNVSSIPANPTANCTQCLNVNISLPSYDVMSSSSLRTREGTLLVDGCVDIYWNKPFRADIGDPKAYLECSICSMELDYSTADEKGLEDVFRNMKQHIMEDHEDVKNDMVLRFGKRMPHPCPYSDCCVLFANPESRDKHEVAHRTCDVCGEMVGKIGLTRRQRQAAMLAHKRFHDEKDKKRKGDTASEVDSSVNKKKRTD